MSRLKVERYQRSQSEAVPLLHMDHFCQMLSCSGSPLVAPLPTRTAFAPARLVA